jgi:hypothetical protein
MGDQLIQFIIALFAESFLVTLGIILIVVGIAFGVFSLKKMLKGGQPNES